MDEPIGVQAVCELLLTLKLAVQREVTIACERLDAEQVPPQSAFRDGDRLVGRFVVDQVR